MESAGGDIAAWLAADDLDAVRGSPKWVALLPGLDPTTMGWKDRSWYLEAGVASRIVDRNGNAGPTIWVDGRVVGSWVQRKDGTIALGWLTDVPPVRRAQVEATRERWSTSWATHASRCGSPLRSKPSSCRPERSRTSGPRSAGGSMEYSQMRCRRSVASASDGGGVPRPRDTRSRTTGTRSSVGSVWFGHRGQRRVVFRSRTCFARLPGCTRLSE